ncbi:MAG: hypothetical protein R2698_12015 [Microthrixaceae bacterium]
MTSEPTADTARLTPDPPGATEGASAGGKGAASSAAELVRLSSFVLLNVGAFLLIIHYLSPADMGWYALINVVTNLAFVVADLQMDKVAVRRISQGDDPEEVIGAAVGVRLVGSILATIATQAVFMGIGLARGEVRGDVQLAALLASSQFLGESFFVVGAIFQAQLRAYLDVVPRILYLVLRFALTLVLLEAGAPWWALFVAWVLGYAIGDAAALVLFRIKTGNHLRLRLAGTGPLVREALTLGIASLLGMASVQFGTVYLGVTAPSRTIAVFNAAILPIQYLSMFGGVVAIVAFPLVSEAWAAHDMVRFGRIDAIARTGILALFAPVCILLFQVPLAPAMEKVFGRGYGAAARPLQLMSVALVLVSVMIWAGFVFLSVGKPRLIIMVNLACLIVGVASCPLVVPRFGLEGLAAVGIGATGLAMILALALSRQFTPGGFDVSGSVRLAIACTGLWGSLEIVGRVNNNFLLLVIVGIVVYPLLVALLRVFPRTAFVGLRADDASRSGGPRERRGVRIDGVPLEGRADRVHL